MIWIIYEKGYKTCDYFTKTFKMANKKIDIEKVERPQLAKHDSKCLDLAFAMDCTGV